MKVALIPARGGSKRIPRKNIKDFCGKPILAYSIEAAQETGIFDEIIVSTDDREIADVARELGASVPFVRPSEVANDFATIMDVMRHTIEWYRSEYTVGLDYLCLIYATAPFVRVEDVKKGLQILQSNPHRGSSMSVAKYTYPIQRALRIADKGELEMINTDYLASRSQDLEEAYMDAAQFIWTTPAALDNCKQSLLEEGVSPVEIPHWCVQDIDTMEDWERAELIYHANRLRESM